MPAGDGEFMVRSTSPARVEADHMARYEYAVRLVRPRMRVLDFACGSGYGTAMLGSAAADVTAHGVDLSPDALELARRHAAQHTAYFQGDITAWRPADGGLYDLITCFETIEHVPDHVGALRNLRQLIAPNGTLLISSPNRPITTPNARSLDDQPKNKFHVREFLPAELQEAVENEGFRVEPLVLGQRPHLPIPGRWGRRYRRRFKPEERTSPAVRRYRMRVPRYFLLTAYPS